MIIDMSGCKTVNGYSLSAHRAFIGRASALGARARVVGYYLIIVVIVRYSFNVTSARDTFALVKSVFIAGRFFHGLPKQNGMTFINAFFASYAIS